MEPTIFTTQNGNTYLYSPFNKTFLPINKSIKQEFEDGTLGIGQSKVLHDNDYFKSKYELFNGRISEKDIILAVSNLPQVIFEVTSACNLRCDYCCYGHAYEIFKNRVSGELSFQTAKSVLDYLSEKMSDIDNISANTPFVISFYGGEPLLNIRIIKKIVQYSKRLRFHNRILGYSMTTNATHLAENIEFLKNNNFRILVSLDGDKFANQHRKKQDGTNSFDDILKNLYYVKEKYPDYFKTLRYNAVFSATSDIDDVLDYFREEFGTIPQISMIHEPDLAAPGYNYIKNLRKPIDLPSQNQHSDEVISQIPLYKRIANLLFKLTHNHYSSEIDMLAGETEYYATGTCIPFSKKMFITTNGNILPCEKICRDIPLGFVINKDVVIDYTQLAHRHNQVMDSVKKQCELCYLQSCCNQCAHNFKNRHCSAFKTQSQFREMLSEAFSYMESHPEIINIIENNIILR